jgi:hypothetical protein
MGNSDAPSNDPAARDETERRLRGSQLEGSEQKKSVDHAAYEKSRNPDTELRLDGEKDSLYNDGLDIDEEDTEDPLLGTRGNSSGIKP